MNCGALILAAGASTRLGRPKQLATLHGETLLERSIRTAREAGCNPVVVVLGAHEEMIRRQCDLRETSVVVNPDWLQGMGTSLSLGVRACKGIDGLVVMTCDMPVVTSKHLKSLMSGGRLMASGYAGRKGVPAYFPSDFFPALMDLRGDVGARAALQNADEIELPGGTLDVDTESDLAEALRRFS